MPKRAKRPRDRNQPARRIVEDTVRESPPEPDPEDPEAPQRARDNGRLGGLKGGKARAEKLSPEERAEIARRAAQARWAARDS